MQRRMLFQTIWSYHWAVPLQVVSDARNIACAARRYHFNCLTSYTGKVYRRCCSSYGGRARSRSAWEELIAQRSVAVHVSSFRSVHSISRRQSAAIVAPLSLRVACKRLRLFVQHLRTDFSTRVRPTGCVCCGSECVLAHLWKYIHPFIHYTIHAHTIHAIISYHRTTHPKPTHLRRHRRSGDAFLYVVRGDHMLLTAFSRT